jgi:serine/threonine protein phosphatase PrpC
MENHEDSQSSSCKKDAADNAMSPHENSFRGFHCSIQGDSHIRRNIEIQDASNFMVDSSCAIVAVSDGHGGGKHFRSAIGSKWAVTLALGQTKKFINHLEGEMPMPERKFDAKLEQLEKNIIFKWREAVLGHFAKKPLTDEEEERCRASGSKMDSPETFYGATLLFAAMTKSYAFAAQIGDGACVFLDQNGEPSQPVAGDRRLIFNETTSLCDADAISAFRQFYREDAPEAIFVSTDGVVNSYTEEKFLNFNRIILTEMRKDSNKAKQELANWLPILSEKGSGDDVSIAGIYRLSPRSADVPQKACGLDEMAVVPASPLVGDEDQSLKQAPPASASLNGK